MISHTLEDTTWKIKFIKGNWNVLKIPNDQTNKENANEGDPDLDTTFPMVSSEHFDLNMETSVPKWKGPITLSIFCLITLINFQYVQNFKENLGSS